MLGILALAGLGTTDAKSAAATATAMRRTAFPFCLGTPLSRMRFQVSLRDTVAEGAIYKRLHYSGSQASAVAPPSSDSRRRSSPSILNSHSPGS